MSETARDGKDRRHARIGALTDEQRRFLLAFLVGYAPEAADTALDDLEGRTLTATAVQQDAPSPAGAGTFTAQVTEVTDEQEP